MIRRSILLLAVIAVLYGYSTWHEARETLRGAVEWLMTPKPIQPPQPQEERRAALKVLPSVEPSVPPPRQASLQPALTITQRQGWLNREIESTERELLELANDPLTDEVRRTRERLVMRLAFLNNMLIQLL